MIMNFNDYQKETRKTANMKLNDDKLVNDKMIKMVLGLGLSGEAGEAVDLLKKHLGHGHDIDLDKFEKELGDVLWYVARLADEFGIEFSSVAEKNVAKLRARYPNGFTEQDSKNRKDK